MGRELSRASTKPTRKWPDSTDADQVRRGRASATISNETPANVILFAGYGFAKEYRQARGHVHAIEDVTATKRVERQDAGHVLDVQEPRRAAADARDRRRRKFYAGGSTT